LLALPGVPRQKPSALTAFTVRDGEAEFVNTLSLQNLMLCRDGPIAVLSGPQQILPNVIGNDHVHRHASIEAGIVSASGAGDDLPLAGFWN
jgi:hypothetical protein